MADPCAYSDYLRGYGNGIILGHSIIFGTVANFIQPEPRPRPGDTVTVGVDPAHGADAMAYAFMRDGKALGTMKEFVSGEPFELADLRRQLETAKMLEAFWRKTAATRGERIKSLGDQAMDMGEMMDRLTGRITGA